MKTIRLSDSQLLPILKESEAGGAMAERYRQHGTRQVSFYKSRARYSGMDVLLTRRMKKLEDEIRRLKHMLAETSCLMTYSRKPLKKAVAPRSRRALARWQSATVMLLCGWPARLFKVNDCCHINQAVPPSAGKS
jgi:putative transposase